jgi:hypothetical protein
MERKKGFTVFLITLTKNSKLRKKYLVGAVFVKFLSRMITGAEVYLSAKPKN